jgi:hypothetical protein
MLLIFFNSSVFFGPPPSSYFHTNFLLYVFVNRDRAGCKEQYFGLYEHAYVFLSFPFSRKKKKNDAFKPSTLW